jgi:hypothetical protein
MVGMPILSLCLSDSVYAVAASAQTMGLVATGGGDDSAYLWRIGQVEEAPVQLKGQALPQGTVQGSVGLAAF